MEKSTKALNVTPTIWKKVRRKCVDMQLSADGVIAYLLRLELEINKLERKYESEINSMKRAK